MAWTRESHEAFFADKPPGFKIAYYRYNGMRGRCGNPNYVNYARYGGRGIEVRVGRADFIRWFIQKAKGDFTLEVDRKNNDGHYELRNMALVTHAENIQKAYKQVPKIARVGLRNMRCANAARKQRVQVGKRVFTSLNAAGVFYGSRPYIKNRIRKYDSRMPDGTLITLLPKGT